MSARCRRMPSRLIPSLYAGRFDARSSVMTPQLKRDRLTSETHWASAPPARPLQVGGQSLGRPIVRLPWPVTCGSPSSPHRWHLNTR